MLAKTIIQNLEDSELIRIFLDFVQTFHLQYQKINKEISYKCHEATWILATTKATGYGRTQSQAYKHALRNLLQILIEDPPYVEFFSTAIQKSSTKNNSHSLTNSVNPFENNKNSKSHAYSKQNIKTETDISEEEGSKERYSMCHKKKDYERSENPPLREKSLSSHNSTFNHSFSNSKLPLNFSINKNTQAEEKDEISLKQKERKEKQVYHTKINLNRSGQYPHPPLCKQDSGNYQIGRSSVSTNEAKSKTMEEEIQKARQKMKRLEQQLYEVNRQNQALKEQLNPQNTLKQKSYNKPAITGSTIPPSSSYTNALRLSTGSVKSSYQNCASNNNGSQMKTQPAVTMEEDYENYSPVGASSGADDKKSLQNTNANPKVFVPKLKLEILPNYHKKSEKSLNESLLAVYNQKHGGSKKLI